ncbi:MAG: hypothetical protein WD904_03605 [Dehalococcoidia bacterium]
MLYRLLILLGVIAAFAACGGADSPPNATVSPTPDVEAANAVRAVMEAQQDDDAAPLIGQEFDCTLQGGGPAPGFSIEGQCSWDVEVSSDGSRVTYTQKWRCADFAGMGPGYEPCVGEFGRYLTEALVRPDGEVENVGSSGQLPPAMVE